MTRYRRNVALLLVAAIVISSCSNDGDSGSSTEVTAASEVTEQAAVGDDLDSVLNGAQSSDTSPTTQSDSQTFSDEVWPLTGVFTAEDAETSRAALAVKIDNIDQARPQAGINQADIVFEERVEGGLSRILAIYHSQGAPEVGPIRSARSTDVPILMSLQSPLFAWSGANAAFAELIQGANIKDVGYSAAPLGTYTADPSRSAPSNLFSSTEQLRDATVDPDGAPRSIFRYLAPGEELPAQSRQVSSVSVTFGSTDVLFTWDETRGGWIRTQNGTEHVDASGTAIAFTNLVVQFVEYRDTGQVDSNGIAVPEAVLQSRFRPVWYLINGQLVTGSWQKASSATPFQYTFDNGRFAQLQPGSTWIVLVEESDASFE